MSRLLNCAAMVAAMVAMPAAAATWVFGGTVGTATSYSTTVLAVPTAAGGTADVTFTAVARRFTPLPSALTNVSQLISTTTGNAAQRVDRTTSSIGVVGGANTQLDTNNPNQYEALQFSIDNLVRLRGVTLSVIDSNDTLQIYGIDKATGGLTSLGYDGRIQSGLGGAASFVNTAANSGTTALTFTNHFMDHFSGYVFTTRNPGNIPTDGDLGQGYRIDSITAEVLPEPSSWLLMIVGFGLTGASMRRRSAQTA